MSLPYELYYEEPHGSRTLNDIKRDRITSLKGRPEILPSAIEAIAKGIYFAYHGAFVALGIIGSYIDLQIRKWAYGK